MNLIRRRGQIGKQHAAEQAHQRIYGEVKPYWLIAAELYQEHPSQAHVQKRLRERYGVEVSEKTAGLWVNRAAEELASGVETDNDPAEQVAA